MLVNVSNGIEPGLPLPSQLHSNKMIKNKNKICVIDDNESICHSLEILFKSIYADRFDVFTYSNPVLFLEEFLPTWEGCVIIDLFMPCWNGLDLMKELIRRRCRMRYVITSGHGDMKVAAKSVHAGAISFLSKPFNINYLLAQMNTILSPQASQGVK